MLPIRPVRQVKRYEEHQDFYRFSVLKKSLREQSRRPARPSLPSAPPYAREAELDAAEHFAKAVAAVLHAAAHLKESVEELKDSGSGSVLRRRIARVSPPGVLEASVGYSAPVCTLQLEIRRLAATQLNRTAFFAPEAPTIIAYGPNRMRVTAGGRSTDLDWMVGVGDTHRTVLERIRHIWNYADTGIRALLETDPDTGRIRLALSERETGAAAAFILQDVLGNTGSATGLLVKDRAAADAWYRIDGGEWVTFPTNRITLPEYKLNLWLKTVTKEPALLEIVPDTDFIAIKLAKLDETISLVEKELDRSSEYMNDWYARSLQVIREKFRPDTMASRIKDQSSDMESIIGGQDGLAAELSRLLAHMEAGPAEQLLNRSNSRYKRYANYLSSLDWYSQLPSRGLLLNSFY